VICNGALWDEGITPDGGIIITSPTAATFEIFMYDALTYASGKISIEVQNA
jgi:hypothetical protein